MEKSQRALIVVCTLASPSDPQFDRMVYGGIDKLGPAVVDQILSSQYGFYKCLKDADATYDRLLAELEEAAKTQGIKAIDLIVILHGWPGYLYFYDTQENGTNTEDIGNAIRHLNIQNKLRMVYSTACYGATHNADFITGGFDVAIGAKGINDNAMYEFPLFVDNWRMGNTVTGAIHNADDTIAGRFATWLADQGVKQIYGSEVNSEKQIDGAGSTTIDSGDISPVPPPNPWVVATYSIKKQWVEYGGRAGIFDVELDAWAYYLIAPVQFTWDIENNAGTWQNPGCKDGSSVTASLLVGPFSSPSPPYKHQYSVNVHAAGGNGDSADFSFPVILPCEAVIVPLYDASGSVKATDPPKRTKRGQGDFIVTTDWYYYKQIEVAIVCNGVFPPFKSVTWTPTPISESGEHAVFSMMTGNPSSPYQTVSISVDGVDAIGQNFSIQNSMLLPYLDVTHAKPIPRHKRRRIDKDLRHKRIEQKRR